MPSPLAFRLSGHAANLLASRVPCVAPLAVPAEAPPQGPQPGSPRCVTAERRSRSPSPSSSPPSPAPARSPAPRSRPPRSPPCRSGPIASSSLVNASYQAVSTVEQRALWDAATDVSPAHDAAAEAAGKARAAFNGNPAVITEAKTLLERRSELEPLTVRQLERVLLNAAEGPMTNPDLVRARIEAETRQASTLNGFTFMLDGQSITPNEIDERLEKLTDLPQRLAVWEASKQTGPALKPGLVRLQELRNGVARELGYHDYFALQVAGHDMTTEEMVKLNEDFLRELKPLYVQLHTWAKYELAKKYGQPVPKRIPAHWIPNRWSQEWNAMASSASLDAAFRSHEPEWVVKAAEGFWSGLGMGPLPASFWKNSDLYPVPEGDARKKNTHASCWHVDLRPGHPLPDERRGQRAVVRHGAPRAGSRLLRPQLRRAPRSRRFCAPAPARRSTRAWRRSGEMAARQTPYLQSLGLVAEGEEDAMRSLRCSRWRWRTSHSCSGARG